MQENKQWLCSVKVEGLTEVLKKGTHTSWTSLYKVGGPAEGKEDKADNSFSRDNETGSLENEEAEEMVCLLL